MDLRFEGDLALWQATGLALLAAGLAWWLYRRETRKGVGGVRAWLLPALRALAVFMIVFMLAGPVLHHREILGQLSRVLVFIDASGSMSLEDPHLPPDRKLLAVHQRGWLPKGTVDTTAVDIAEELAEINATAAEALRPTLGEQQLRPLLRRFAEQIEVVAGRFDDIDRASLPVAEAKQGSLTREFWTNIGGSSIGDIQQIKGFPGQPSGRSSLSQFESPANWGDNHVQRLVGYVHPPKTGNYTFWITSDDHSELFLSTDQDPSNRKRVAYLHGVAGRGSWPDGSARSAPIPLQAGRRYFIEAIHKEGNGDDWVAVGWHTPDNQAQRPIPGAHLSPLLGSETGDFAAVADAAESLGNVPLKDEKARSAARARLRTLSRDVSDWERRLRLAFRASAQQVAESQNKAVTAALARFDQMSRWRRAESLLLAERTGLLHYLSQKHHLELYALRDEKTERLPTPEELDGSEDATLAAQPDGRVTDLGGGIRRRLDRGTETSDESQRGEPERTAVVILTDGRNNAGEQSPVNVAKLLGSQKIPIYTVGLGSHQPPPDLAILRTRTGPIRSVFVDDQVTGEIELSDTMAPGQSFVIRIEHDGQELWEKQLVSQGGAIRRVPYAFPVKELVSRQADQADGDVEVRSLPLAMTVSVAPLTGEAREDNNTMPLHARVITQERKILIVDGRPRWETRYVRNLLERDRRWTVNAVLAGQAAESQKLRRGTGDGEFPPDMETLFGYDLIVLGEIDPELFTEEEVQWLHDFVDKRGGGLIYIDGRRGRLREMASTRLGPTLPVKWESQDENEPPMPARLELADAGARAAALQLHRDAETNAELWRLLPPPHWVAPVQAVPGGQPLVMAHYGGDEAAAATRSAPAMVFRPYGAGRVLYCGFDESWRWRYQVVDKYHEPFWHQLGEWIMERPYAVSDQFVSLDVGRTVYQPGQTARIRVRLRDEDGKPVREATAEALVWKDGETVGSILLAADENQGGVFRGESDPLEQGDYKVTVRVTGFDDARMKAETTFAVADRDTSEMAVLSCNESLLQQMAATSGGAYLREEQAAHLPDRLEPLSAGQVVESDTVLWTDWRWFIPLVALLSVEWLIRKRTGML